MMPPGNAGEYTRSILATLREPFLVLDHELRVESANRPFCQLFQVKEAEILGRPLMELEESHWEVLRELLTEVLPRDRTAEGFPLEQDLGSGLKLLLLNGRLARAADMEHDVVFLAIQDVTAQRRTEDALRESEEWHRTLVGQVKDYAIFRTDTDGRASTWNEGVQRVLGFTEEEFIGSDVTTAIFTPEDVQSGVPWREMEEASRSGTAGNDRWMQRKDGSRFFAAGVTTALRDTTGTLVGFTKVMRDQTERMEIEDALHISEVRYRRLFEAAKDGILILDDATGRIINVNAFMAELLGASQGELLGKNLAEIGLFSSPEANGSFMQDLREKGVVRIKNLPVVTQDNRQVDFEMIANIYEEKQRSVIQCNVRDITERRRLERQTQEQAETLADLHRRKDEFLAMLSHELRNPLAPISNAIQILRLHDRNDDDVALQARMVIERQVGQLKLLVDDLLEVSRIATGRLQLRFGNVGLNEIVERSVETVRPLIDFRSHELIVNQPVETLTLHADPARMEQVVVNLLTNAAKYTEERGKIYLTTCREGSEAVLKLRDTGVGIAPELLPHIFDMFAQAERSLDRSDGGLGIGLTLVQRIVEMHGGSVVVRSTPGEGSEFEVRLPLATAAELASSSEPELSATAGHCRVLVVDDNLDNARTLGILLEALGHRVEVAYDGPGALCKARELVPRVILLDIGLPGKNGYEVARELRAEPELARAVIVAMTGYGQEADRQQSREAGFDHHLVKPADPQELLRILADASEQTPA